MAVQGFWNEITTGIQSGIDQFSQALSSISAPAQSTEKVPGALAKLNQQVQGSSIGSGSGQTQLIKLIQGSLKSLGYYQSGSIDGLYGPKTKNAVMSFQKANNLPQDGIVGPVTATKLYEKIEAQKRRGQLIPSLINLAAQWGASELMDEYPQINPNVTEGGGGQGTTPTITPTETQGINWKPILIAGGALVGVILLVKR